MKLPKKWLNTRVGMHSRDIELIKSEHLGEHLELVRRPPRHFFQRIPIAV